MVNVDYLRRYHKDIKIIDNIKEVNESQITEEWKFIFSQKDMGIRKELIIKEWEKNLKYELSRTIEYLKNNIKSINLISYRNCYAILYEVVTEDGDIDYYEGGNPLDTNNHKLLNGMPIKLKLFYTQLHNGFFYYPSRMIGISPISEVTIFLQDEWGIIYEIEKPLGININSTYGFFKSGMGGYLAIDYENCEHDNATLWFTNKEPKYNVNFWDMVDEWILMSFE